MLRNILIVCLLSALADQAVAGCPGGTYRGLFGKCWPECDGSICGAIQRSADLGKGLALGPGLAAWILASRNTSIQGAQPIPDNIRQALTGYIDDDVMGMAMYRVGDPGVVNLGGTVVRFGDVQAVTLIDVIIFKTQYDALNNPGLWAHELTHVKQYRGMGVPHFAFSYMERPSNVEDNAYTVGNGFQNWFQANNPDLNPAPLVAPPGFRPGGPPPGF
jgi:hypothetical protein